MNEGYNYKSNLEAPDLRPYFKHTWERVTPQSYGHLVLSDFYDKLADDPVFAEWRNICGFWTLDEAAILYNCAKQIGGSALDIGAHTGWTALYLKQCCETVTAIDPMYSNEAFRNRRKENLSGVDRILCIGGTSVQWFMNEWHCDDNAFDVVVIDGNHSCPCPVVDAVIAAKVMGSGGIILLHDYRGEPIKEAYRWLLANGFKGRTYTTPNGVAVCWRSEFTPPDHVPDPKLPLV